MKGAVDRSGSSPARSRTHATARASLRTAVVTSLLAASCARPRPEAPIVSRPSEIEFPATVHPARFDRSFVMPGYQVVVWRGGHAHSAALLDADVSDRSVLAALSAIARPGPSIPMEAWERRNDPTANNPAPDIRSQGPRVRLFLRI